MSDDDPEMKVVLTRATNAILAMNHSTTQLVGAVQKLEKQISNPPPPLAPTHVVTVRWALVVVVAAAVGAGAAGLVLLVTWHLLGGP